MTTRFPRLDPSKQRKPAANHPWALWQPGALRIPRKRAPAPCTGTSNTAPQQDLISKDTEMEST